MPAAPDNEKPIVAHFRSALFNPSEGFVQAQVAALTRWRPLLVGLERRGALLPGLGDGMIVAQGAAERLAFRLGRVGRIAERLRAARPALIHAHFGPDGLLALPLARALGIPLIVSLRGYDVTRGDAALLRSGRFSWMRYALGKRRLQREGALFLAVSEALRAQAIARGYPAMRTRTHYNGVDLERFRPGEGPREPGLILHVGRLVEKKGTAVLIEALRRVPGARLVVIGDGPLRERLERQSRGLDVRFLGRLPAAEVAAWMRRASVLAAPSLVARDGDAEGLPNVVVEAAASGLPVVATRHSGIPEAVIDGETGLLVPENDIAALARALAADLGDGGRRLAEERFDRRWQTERLEAIYDEVAGLSP